MTTITDQLIKNNVLLQKKTTELIISVNELVKKIDTMVTMFSTAAENIEKQGGELSSTRLNELLEQNKKVAKGLLMLEKYVREKSTFSPAVR